MLYYIIVGISMMDRNHTVARAYQQINFTTLSLR